MLVFSAARVMLATNLEIGVCMLDNALLGVVDCNAGLYELVKLFKYDEIFHFADSNRETSVSTIVYVYGLKWACIFVLTG